MMLITFILLYFLAYFGIKISFINLNRKLRKGWGGADEIFKNIRAKDGRSNFFSVTND